MMMIPYIYDNHPFPFIYEGVGVISVRPLLNNSYFPFNALILKMF